ncbi:MAG TPA: AAA family ATPase [Desulfobacterales bacterium]
MTKHTTGYVPGSYVGRTLDAARMAENYVRSKMRRRPDTLQEKPADREIAPTICFSRKIGVGALEIADRVGQTLGYRVADRLILEHITDRTELSGSAVKFFDERYPGKISELAAFLFGEKSFVMSDYLRSLVSSIYSLAEAEPTIFVGRGTHLLLPRDRVLAVRCIGSDDYRRRRLSRMLNISESEAGRKLKEVDKEQREFFKKSFNRKSAPPDEFDLVMNLDFLHKPRWAADIVATAFRRKFGSMLKKKSAA